MITKVITSDSYRGGTDSGARNRPLHALVLFWEQLHEAQGPQTGGECHRECLGLYPLYALKAQRCLEMALRTFIGVRTGLEWGNRR